MTRSSANWTAHPGGYDALHCERHIWPSEEGAYGTPSLQPQRFDLLPSLRLHPHRFRLDRLDLSRDCCQFYLDDYRFESTWTRLDIGARHGAGYFATLTADFSLYPDWPIAAQLWIARCAPAWGWCETSMPRVRGICGGKHRTFRYRAVLPKC